MHMKRPVSHSRSEARGACRGLAQLPVWLVPPRWSNFSCWAQLGETLANQLRTLLAMPPALRDVGAKMALLQSVLCGMGALWTARLLTISERPFRPVKSLPPAGEGAPAGEK